MKRRAEKELGVFSVSAIDLFAASMGAFIIISLMLFPYFTKTENLWPLIQELRAENKALKDSLAEAQGQVAALSAEVAALEAAAAASARETARLQGALEAGAHELAQLKKGAAFLGIEPISTRYQIALDLSGSMLDNSGALPTAMRAIDAVLSRLEPGDELRVMTFQGDPGQAVLREWPAGGGWHRVAGPGSADEAAAFLRGASPAGNTPTFDALERMLAAGSGSSIFLITDGVPTIAGAASDRHRNLETAIDQATARNGGRHQINLVALGNFISVQGANQIVPLATRNGGALVVLP